MVLFGVLLYICLEFTKEQFNLSKYRALLLSDNITMDKPETPDSCCQLLVDRGATAIIPRDWKIHTIGFYSRAPSLFWSCWHPDETNTEHWAWPWSDNVRLMSIKRLIFNTFHSLVIFTVFQFLLSFYIKTNLLRSESAMNLTRAKYIYYARIKYSAQAMMGWCSQ